MKFSGYSLFIKNILRKKIVLFPACNISIVDVRNIAHFASQIITKKFKNEKIILNDKTLSYNEYINLISKNKIKFKISILFAKVIFKVSNLVSKFGIKNLSPITEARLFYMKMNPFVKGFKYERILDYKNTISDTVKFFKKE